MRGDRGSLGGIGDSQGGAACGESAINMGINDYAGPTSESSFKASARAAIDMGKVSDDVILFIQNQISSGGATPATFAQYMRDLATLNDLIPIYIPSFLGTYVEANAAGTCPRIARI
jgi:hypothetical protein